jgi:YHS domain-containing protein
MTSRVLFSLGLVAVVMIAGQSWADDKEAPAPGCRCCSGNAAVALASDESPVKDEKAEKKAEPKCPISDKKISKDASADYKGGKVYFCCAGCIEAFKKDQAKFETKANLQLVATGQAKQKGCPLSGGKASESSLEVAGVPVHFCCDGCKGKVKEAAAEKQLEMVFGTKAFDKAFAVKKPDVKKTDN